MSFFFLPGRHVLHYPLPSRHFLSQVRYRQLAVAQLQPLGGLEFFRDLHALSRDPPLLNKRVTVLSDPLDAAQ